MLGASLIAVLAGEHPGLPWECPSTRQEFTMSQFRPVLVIFSGPSSVYPGKVRISADVQIWRGNVCITTVKCADFMDAAGPDLSDITTVEQFAVIMSRFTSRMCDEELFERIRAKSIHHWRDIERQFPAPTSVEP